LAGASTEAVPICAKASLTAFVTAGIAQGVPASPTPVDRLARQLGRDAAVLLRGGAMRHVIQRHLSARGHDCLAVARELRDHMIRLLRQAGLEVSQ